MEKFPFLKEESGGSNGQDTYGIWDGRTGKMEHSCWPVIGWLAPVNRADALSLAN